MKIFAAAILILLTTTAAARFNERVSNYYLFLNQASRCDAEGKIDSAIYFAKRATNNYSHGSKAFTFLAGLYIKQQDYKSAVLVYKNAILCGNIPDKINYFIERYDSVKHIAIIADFIKQIPVLSSKFYSEHYNIKLSKLVYKMYGRDQAIRGIENVYNINDTVIADSVFSVQSYLDTAINLPILLEYIHAYGFPEYCDLDDDLSRSFGLIIHHLLQYESRGTTELEGLVRQAVYNGQYSAYSMMLALDYRYIGKNHKQIYGTYIVQCADGSYKFDPEINDVESVDIRRSEWKQAPLKEIKNTDWRDPKLPANYIYKPWY